MTLTRSRLLLLKLALVCGLAGCSSPAAIEPVNVNFDYVRQMAASVAAAPYDNSSPDLPPALGALTYDDYRDIRFRPSQALWRGDGLPFQLQFFHRGGIYREKVTIREFSATHQQVIPFVRDFFNYELKKDVGTLHSSLGYAGFRVHTPINRPDLYDELIVFLGSSYFRAIGAGQVYGLSGRGLAVDCGLPDRGEEFPRFTDFWVGKPKAGDSQIVIYALLQSASVTGAYEFVVTPGKSTVVSVRTELTFRREVSLPGIAPLTSMYWFGENSNRPPGQMRPEVHDSDGLLVHDEIGGRIWQPVHNPARPEFSVLPVKKLTRFGLVQRDRRMASYEDLEAHYELRPSAWIEPIGDWGDGSIRLVELPAGDEFGDNIVAFWVPAKKITVGRPIQFSYRIVWALDEPSAEGLARVVGTREGEMRFLPRGRRFWVDFSDDGFAKRNPARLVADIEVTGGKLHHQSISLYPQIGGWRVAVEVEADGSGQPLGMRCRLREGTQPISETWSYHWNP